MFHVSHHSTSHPPIQTSPVLTSCPVGRNYSATHLTFLGSERAAGTFALVIFKCIFQTCPKPPLASHTDTHNMIFVLLAQSLDSAAAFFWASAARLTGWAQRLSVIILKKLTSPILPPGNLTALELSFADSLLERNSSGNQTFPLESFRSPQPNEECVIFDPVGGKWGQARCDSLRGAVCQFQKGKRKKEMHTTSFIYSLQSVI